MNLRSAAIIRSVLLLSLGGLAMTLYPLPGWWWMCFCLVLLWMTFDHTRLDEDDDE